jgi:Taurine catabolism dioxygenase TauD, TfdA family
VIAPAIAEIDAVAWATTQRRPIRELLLRHGGILFRGFTRGSVETFRSFIAAVSGEPLPYMEGSSPRHEVADRVYTSTDYPHATGSPCITSCPTATPGRYASSSTA